MLSLTVPTPTLRDRLLTQHRQLERLFGRVLDAFDADAREETQALWAQLEDLLTKHFDLEERLVLPHFQKVDSAEVRLLLDQHQQLRARLLELGIAVQLKSLRAEQAHAFIELLKAHAQREDRLLYRWLERHAPSVRELVAGHLHH